MTDAAAPEPTQPSEINFRKPSAPLVEPTQKIPQLDVEKAVKSLNFFVSRPDLLVDRYTREPAESVAKYSMDVLKMHMDLQRAQNRVNLVQEQNKQLHLLASMATDKTRSMYLNIVSALNQNDGAWTPEVRALESEYFTAVNAEKAASKQQEANDKMARKLVEDDNRTANQIEIDKKRAELKTDAKDVDVPLDSFISRHWNSAVALFKDEENPTNRVNAVMGLLQDKYAELQNKKAASKAAPAPSSAQIKDGNLVLPNGKSVKITVE